MIRDELFKKVKRILKEDGTVLFVGSGISAWSGLPGWGKLLEDMADYVDKCGKDSSGIRDYKNSQPLIAADHGCSQLTSEQFHHFLKAEFHREKKYSVPSQAHELLMNLGVNCFITTNYDRLLENTLKQRHLLRRYQVVTNQEPGRCAELLSIKSRNFIFKPHGDIERPDSIVLSNCQYDELYENGTRTYAYRALENLLVSRKIVFIGFGLTDPDFLRIMGKFRNEYKGTVSENYAIMPDINPAQAQYWKDTYGIHILTYETFPTEGGRDYGELLALLKALAPGTQRLPDLSAAQKTEADQEARMSGTAVNPKRFTVTARQKEALGFYARSLEVRLKVEEDHVFPLTICKANGILMEDNGTSSRRKARGSRKTVTGEARESSTEEILNSEARESFLLTGSPGSGKSFFLKRYCLKIAGKLLKWLQGEEKGGMPPVPVYVDLKNYSGAGSIRQMIVEQFPEEIPVLDWIENNKVFLIFDSYNEVDVKYQDSRSCYQEIESYGLRENIIIASRYREGFSLFMREYELIEVEEDYVVEFLAQHGPESGTIPQKVWELLTTPLVFQLLVSGRVDAGALGSVRDIYESYFHYLFARIQERFGFSLNIMDAFDGLALDVFEKGRETFDSAELELAVESSLTGMDGQKIREILNFLMDSENFLTPLRNGRFSFFHQSVTEFLAARRLAGMEAGARNVEEKLKNLRWNYIMLFLVSFLDGEETEKYMDQLLRTDSLLAIQASVYTQEGREKAASQILEYLCEYGSEKSFEYLGQLEMLEEIPPFTPHHAGGLRQLMKAGDLLGAAAAG